MSSLFFLGYPGWRFINFIDLFKELAFDFIDFSLFSHFSISLVSPLILIISFILLALGLNCGVGGVILVS